MGDRVGLDDLGADGVEEPGWGDLTEVLVQFGGQDGIDGADRDGVQLAGQARGLPRDPDFEPEVLHRGPPGREAVAQVEGVGNQLPRRQRVDPAGDGELGQAQVLHLRGPLPADLDQPVLTAPDPSADTSQLGVGGVEVGPVDRQRQITCLCRTTLDQRALDLGQRGAGVQGVEVGEGRWHAPSLLEHLFELKGVDELVSSVAGGAPRSSVRRSIVRDETAEDEGVPSSALTRTCPRRRPSRRSPSCPRHAPTQYYLARSASDMGGTLLSGLAMSWSRTARRSRGPLRTRRIRNRVRADVGHRSPLSLRD